MKRPILQGFVALAAAGAVVLVISFNAAGRGSLPYLPLIGPPPMRFEVAKTPPNPMAWYVPKSAATSAPPAVATGSGSSGTNTAVAADAKVSAARTPGISATNISDLPAPLASGLSETPPENPEDALGDTITSSVFALPTPDLLGITPEMLATYFRPVQMGTNYPALVGPFSVSFIPPVPPGPPEKSSHAEYIVK
jgi:hypothetical protein